MHSIINIGMKESQTITTIPIIVEKYIKTVDSGMTQRVTTNIMDTFVRKIEVSCLVAFIISNEI